MFVIVRSARTNAQNWTYDDVYSVCPAIAYTMLAVGVLTSFDQFSSYKVARTAEKVSTGEKVSLLKF